MKTFGYLLMAVMACMTCSCRDEEPLPNPVPPVMEPENPGNPEEPDTGKVYIGIAPIIENMQEQRAVVENWKEGHCLGVTAAGDVNIPFTFDGRRFGSAYQKGKQRLLWRRQRCRCDNSACCISYRLSGRCKTCFR